jgi:hypothetical protein
MEQSIPKRRRIKFRLHGITLKKAYNKDEVVSLLKYLAMKSMGARRCISRHF